MPQPPSCASQIVLALLAAGFAHGATLAAPKVKSTLKLRGGLDSKQVLLANAAGLAAFGSEFGSALVGSKWASVRYWDCEPTEGWQQLSEAFGIGLLTLAYVTYDTAQNGDEAAKTNLGKKLSFAWIGWTLMHVKWWQMGTLVTTGPLKSQLGGWVPCATLAALSAKKFLIK